MQIHSLSPKGASTTSFRKSYAHFTAQDNTFSKSYGNFWNLQTPNSVCSKLDWDRCILPHQSLPQDGIFNLSITVTGFGSFWLWGAFGPIFFFLLVSCPGALASFTILQFPKQWSFLCLWLVSLLTLWKSLQLLKQMPAHHFLSSFQWNPSPSISFN